MELFIRLLRPDDGSSRTHVSLRCHWTEVSMEPRSSLLIGRRSLTELKGGRPLRLEKTPPEVSINQRREGSERGKDGRGVEGTRQTASEASSLSA